MEPVFLEFCHLFPGDTDPISAAHILLIRFPKWMLSVQTLIEMANADPCKKRPSSIRDSLRKLSFIGFSFSSPLTIRLIKYLSINILNASFELILG